MHRAITGSRSRRRFILRRAGKCPEQETRTMIRFELKWQLKLDHSTCLKKAWPFLYYSLRKESNLKQVKPVGQWFYSVATVQDIGLKKKSKKQNKKENKPHNSYSTPLKTTVLIQCIRNCLHGQYLFDWVCILFIQENCITLRINCILYQTFCGILLQLCYFSVYSQHSGLCDIWRLYQKDCVTDSLV